MRILIVDDEPLILKAVRRSLFDLDGGHEILTATGGEEALNLLEQNPCDIVLVDMRMPGMSGLELLDHICTRWPDTIRIVLSGYADPRSVSEAKQIAHRFLAKPCGAQALREAISDAVARHASAN